MPDCISPSPRGKTLLAIAGNDLHVLIETANHHHRQLKELLQQSLEHAKAAGDALLTIKASMPHGSFGKWIAANCEFSDRTARRYMLVAEGWGRLGAKRTRVRNLSVREAVKLLADDHVDPVAELSLLNARPGDEEHLPYEWEPGLGEIRIGRVINDGRIIVLRSVPDARFCGCAVINLAEGWHEYGKRPVRRSMLDVLFTRVYGIHPLNDVEWFDAAGDDNAAWISAFAFGQEVAQ